MLNPLHKRVRLLLAALCFACSAQALTADEHPLYREWNQFELERSAPQRFDGPFRSDGLAFYLVHHGGPLRITFDARTTGPTTEESFGRVYDNAFLIRIFSPNGEALETRYHRFQGRNRERFEERVDLDTVPAGIYEIRYTASQGNKIDFNLHTEPGLSFGILPLRNRLYAASFTQFREAYIFVPPGAEKRIPEFRKGAGPHPEGIYQAHMRWASGVIEDLAGNTLATLRHDRTEEIPVEQAGLVWRLRLNLSPHGRSSFAQVGSFDAILCPDPATARNIRGAIHVSRDGKIFPHAFQVGMWEWIDDLSPTDLKVEATIDPERDESLWLDEPRNRHLWGPWGVFSHLPRILERQTLNNPMGDRSTAFALAVAYSLDTPFNPFFRNDGVLNRLLLSEFHRHLTLLENESDRPGWLQFVAADAFEGSRYAYALAARQMHPGDPRHRLWTAGARRYVERYAFHRTSAENQSTHVPLNLLHLSQGTRHVTHHRLAADYMDVLLDEDKNPPLVTGYLMEGYGPDATYQGIATNNLAWYYQMTRDRRTLLLLDRIYTLFNHTVVPEPDGTVVGASNFSHRTAGSWAERQYTGGTLAMADTLEQAAVWHQDYDPGSDTAREEANTFIQEQLAHFWGGPVRQPSGEQPTAYRYAMRYVYHPERILPAKFPAEKEERFFRVFGDEFVAVRRPGYYALIYIGKPDPRVDRVKDTNPDTVHRRTGGGLSLLWLPEKGTVIRSTNNSAWENNMVVAELSDGTLIWPDYWSLEARVDAREERVTIESTLSPDMAKIRRSYYFDDNALYVSLELSDISFHNLSAIKEVIPSIPEMEPAWTSIDLVGIIENRLDAKYADRISDKVELGVREIVVQDNFIKLNYGFSW